MPRDSGDPASQKQNLKEAQRKLVAKFKVIDKNIRAYIKSTIKESQIQTNKEYLYELDADRYNSIDTFLNRLLNNELLGNYQGVYTNEFWLNRNMEKAYRDATGQIIDDMQTKEVIDQLEEPVSDYVKRMDTQSVMLSPPVYKRLQLVYARTFNEMKGLTQSVKTDLSQTLSRGMLDGKGVTAITNDVIKRTGVSYSRALRIVRTETMQAYRSATRSESKEFNDTLFKDTGYHFELLWMSALTSTTRTWHAAKHGGLYSEQDVKKFYSEKGNAINCYCSQRPVLVYDSTGEPLQQSLIKRLKRQKKDWHPQK